ncbi:MAG: 4Fe-4S binding protein [Candidatus Heimdallarchaeota archaeon]
MIVSIASGKGGTGKTTVAINVALSLENCQLLDCDVEEPNAHIFLQPTFTEKKDVKVDIPVIDDNKCTKCGYCAEVCEFNALAALPNTILFFPELCMSCNACIELCPENAISSKKKSIGIINKGYTKDNMEVINGLLNISEPRAIPIIIAVKDQIDPTKNVIIDAPPGNSCPVIETVSETDFCILVTEPTPFGLWDLRIAVEVVKLLKVPFGIILNKSNMGDNNLILDFCSKNDIEVLMSIPYERKIAEAYSNGIALVNYDPTWSAKFRELWHKIEAKVKS